MTDKVTRTADAISPDVLFSYGADPFFAEPTDAVIGSRTGGPGATDHPRDDAPESALPDITTPGPVAPSVAGRPNDDRPPLLRRPCTIAEPRAVSSLRGLRTSLLDHQCSTLDQDSAETVTAGVVDVDLMRAVLAAKFGKIPVNFLEDKSTRGGVIHMLPKHDRYLDLGILPDLQNGRFVHKQLPASACGARFSPSAPYGTLTTPDDKPLAILTVKMANRDVLADAIRESMRNTVPDDGVDNDYTESVLQGGVTEPLLLFLVRVEFDDGTFATYLMCGDGNSRLCSMWKARTNGTIEAAADALIETIIGPLSARGPQQGTRQEPEHKQVRARLGEKVRLVNRGLGSTELMADTIRLGHTLTAPARVVIGITPITTPRGDVVADLAIAREDVAAAQHVLVTPWEEEARHEQGIDRVYRQVRMDGRLNDATYRVVTGTADVTTMHAELGLPPHPLWASAVHQQALLSGPRYYYSRLLREHLGLRQAKREKIGGPIGTVALSPFRSQDGHKRALNAFASGGTIANAVWGTGWTLTQGDTPVTVLDEILAQAIDGNASAVAELIVLGGTAAILTALLSADRGSKARPERSETSTPYRRTPPRLLDKLASSSGGLRMLHSIAVSYVQADNTLPKAFHTRDVFTSDGTSQHRDGDPVLDEVGAHVALYYEYDLFSYADPDETQKALAALQQPGAGGTGASSRAPQVVAREKLEEGLKEARAATRDLLRLHQTGQQATAWGTPVWAAKQRNAADQILQTLTRYAPVSLLDDEDDEDDLAGQTIEL